MYVDTMLLQNSAEKTFCNTCTITPNWLFQGKTFIGSNEEVMAETEGYFKVKII